MPLACLLVLSLPGNLISNAEDQLMDYLSIATSVVTTALVPLFKIFATKTVEEVGKLTGQEAFDKRQSILEAVETLFIGEELTTLGDLRKDPDNEDIQTKVAETIEHKLMANPSIAADLNPLTNRVAKIENIDVKNSKLINRIRLAREQIGQISASIKSDAVIDSDLENEIAID
jgi:hypothetical protein